MAIVDTWLYVIADVPACMRDQLNLSHLRRSRMSAGQVDFRHGGCFAKGGVMDRFRSFWTMRQKVSVNVVFRHCG